MQNWLPCKVIFWLTWEYVYHNELLWLLWLQLFATHLIFYSKFTWSFTTPSKISFSFMKQKESECDEKEYEYFHTEPIANKKYSHTITSIPFSNFWFCNYSILIRVIEDWTWCMNNQVLDYAKLKICYNFWIKG